MKSPAMVALNLSTDDAIKDDRSVVTISFQTRRQTFHFLASPLARRDVQVSSRSDSSRMEKSLPRRFSSSATAAENRSILSPFSLPLAIISASLF